MLTLSDASGFLLPWPFSNLVKIALSSPPPPGSLPPEKRYAEGPVMATPYEHLSLVVGAAWKVLFAAFAYYYCTQPTQAMAADLDPQWMLSVVTRDVLVTLFVGCLWDFIHMSDYSPWKVKLQPFKFKAGDPPSRQIPHDAFWAVVSAVIAAGWEIGLLHFWGRGRLHAATFPNDAWYRDPTTLLLLLALPYIQIVHFYFIHRFMHKWDTPKGVFDLGEFLYRHVHSLHHLSRDPTAFSGISMHPVESTIFFSTMLIAGLLGAHPIVALHYKYYNIVVAMIGHESYGDPSTGGHSHWLHHQLVNCNMGGNFVPLDWWLGTYARDEDDFNEQQERKMKSKVL